MASCTKMRRTGLTVALLLFGAASGFGEEEAASAGQRFVFSSPYYSVELASVPPFVRALSVDSLGRGGIGQNPIEWRPVEGPDSYALRRKSDSEVEIIRAGSGAEVLWSFAFGEKGFEATARDSGDRPGPALGLCFSKERNHATLLGLMAGRNRTVLPALLHLPDMGSFEVLCGTPGAIVDYEASRRDNEKFIRASLPCPPKGSADLRYTFNVTAVYPRFDGVEADRFAGFRRNYVNLYQVNPAIRVLANNSCSDACAFTLFLSSMLALHTPPLAGSLTALDLVRMSIERYLDGMKAYGMVGYTQGYEGTTAVGWSSPQDSLDTAPSLVITACNYVKGSGDTAWAARHYAQIRAWMDGQMARDRDGNGLVEYELSGNAGSWDDVLRPANWWDTIGFGHEDAFSNALTFEALNLMAEVAGRTNHGEDAQRYGQLAKKLKDAYFPTFYNSGTGVLAGWKSRDGKLHDYHFLFVNSMAVYYGLVPEGNVRPIMAALWQKMRDEGFNDFTLGVPGNLASVRREDYTHHLPRWGGGEREDGSDAFQRYENGGASINWSYYTLKALKKAGMDDAFHIVADGILDGITAGAFQGPCENGMTRDWKTWKGECWGYEGYLCDGYLALLALNPEDR